MAKQRQQNTILDAISALTAALRIESIPNPTEEQKQQIHQANIKAASVVESSNLMTAGQNLDDAIDLQHQMEEERERREQELLVAGQYQDDTDDEDNEYPEDN